MEKLDQLKQLIADFAATDSFDERGAIYRQVEALSLDPEIRTGRKPGYHRLQLDVIQQFYRTELQRQFGRDILNCATKASADEVESFDLAAESERLIADITQWQEATS